MATEIHEKDLERIIYDIKKTARLIAGGPDERGLKLLKASGFFLVVPDPTMISTSIGLTMLATGKLLMKRRQKGLIDEVSEYLITLKSAKKMLESLL